MINQEDIRNKDTGLAVLLIMLLLVYFAGIRQLVLPSIIVLLLLMIKPSIFRPLSVFWFGVSEALGTISSKVILSLLYYTIVTPVGLVMQKLRKDWLRPRKWSSKKFSAFFVRDHLYTREDMEKPY